MKLQSISVIQHEIIIKCIEEKEDQLDQLENKLNFLLFPNKVIKESDSEGNITYKLLVPPTADPVLFFKNNKHHESLYMVFSRYLKDRTSLYLMEDFVLPTNTITESEKNGAALAQPKKYNDIVTEISDVNIRKKVNDARDWNVEFSDTITKEFICCLKKSGLPEFFIKEFARFFPEGYLDILNTIKREQEIEDQQQRELDRLSSTPLPVFIARKQKLIQYLYDTDTISTQEIAGKGFLDPNLLPQLEDIVLSSKHPVGHFKCQGKRDTRQDFTAVNLLNAVPQQTKFHYANLSEAEASQIHYDTAVCFKTLFEYNKAEHDGATGNISCAFVRDGYVYIDSSHLGDCITAIIQVPSEEDLRSGKAQVSVEIINEFHVLHPSVNNDEHLRVLKAELLEGRSRTALISERLMSRRHPNRVLINISGAYGDLDAIGNRQLPGFRRVKIPLSGQHVFLWSGTDGHKCSDRKNSDGNESKEQIEQRIKLQFETYLSNTQFFSERKKASEQKGYLSHFLANLTVNAQQHGSEDNIASLMTLLTPNADPTPTEKPPVICLKVYDGHGDKGDEIASLLANLQTPFFYLNHKFLAHKETLTRELESLEHKAMQDTEFKEHGSLRKDVDGRTLLHRAVLAGDLQRVESLINTDKNILECYRSKDRLDMMPFELAYILALLKKGTPDYLKYVKILDVLMESMQLAFASQLNIHATVDKKTLDNLEKNLSTIGRLRKSNELLLNCEEEIDPVEFALIESGLVTHTDAILQQPSDVEYLKQQASFYQEQAETELDVDSKLRYDNIIYVLHSLKTFNEKLIPDKYKKLVRYIDNNQVSEFKQILDTLSLQDNADFNYYEKLLLHAFKKKNLDIFTHLAALPQMKSWVKANGVPSENRAGEENLTIFHDAAKNNQLEYIKVLVETLTVDVNATEGNASPIKPLHIAAQAGHLDVVMYLVQNGANIDIVMEEDHQELTALNLAEARQHSDVVHYLKIQQEERFKRLHPQENNESKTAANELIVSPEASEINLDKDKKSKPAPQQSAVPDTQEVKHVSSIEINLFSPPRALTPIPKRSQQKIDETREENEELWCDVFVDFLENATVQQVIAFLVNRGFSTEDTIEITSDERNDLFTIIDSAAQNQPESLNEEEFDFFIETLANIRELLQRYTPAPEDCQPVRTGLSGRK